MFLKKVKHQDMKLTQLHIALLVFLLIAVLFCYTLL